MQGTWGSGMGASAVPIAASGGGNDDDDEVSTYPGVTGLGVSSSGRVLLSGCRDSNVYIWDLTDSAGPLDVRHETGPVMQLKMAYQKHAIAPLTWDAKTKLQIMRPS